MKKISLSLLLMLLVFAAEISFAQGDPSGGVQFTSSSSPAAVVFKAALRYHDDGDRKKAREMFLKAVAQDPKLSVAYLYLVNYATTPQELVSFLNNAKPGLSTANEWEKMYYDFQETVLTSDMDKRLAFAQKMVAAFPKSARSHLLLGETYSIRNDVVQARESLQQAIAIDPSWPGAYSALINSFLFQEPKDFAQAQHVAEQFVAVAASSCNSHILLGDAYRAQNNLTKAEGEYTKAVALDATQASVFYKRGHIHSFLGNYEKARADYQKAGKLDVLPTMASSFVAFTYLYQGQPQKAIQSLQNSMTGYAASADKAKAATARFEFLILTSDIAAHTGDVKTLQQAIIQLKPVAEELGKQSGTDEGRREYKSTVLLYEGMLKALNKDVSGARQTAEEMKTLLAPINNPRKDEDYHFIQGYTSLQDKDYPNAIMHFEQLKSGDVYSKYSLAKAYEGNGAKEKANALYKDLVNYNFNGVGYALIRNELKKKM